MNSNQKPGRPAQKKSKSLADKVTLAALDAEFQRSHQVWPILCCSVLRFSSAPDGPPRNLTGRLTGRSAHSPFKKPHVFANLSLATSSTTNDSKGLTVPRSRIIKLFKGVDGLTDKIPQATPPLPRRSQTKAGPGSMFKVQSSKFKVRCSRSLPSTLRSPTLTHIGTPGAAWYGLRYGCYIKNTQCLPALVRWYGSRPPRPTPPLAPRRSSERRRAGSKFRVRCSMLDVRCSVFV